MSDYKKIMICITCGTCAGTLFSAILYCTLNIGLLFPLTITFGVTCYHFSARLLIAALIHGRYHNHMDYDRKWFQPHPLEENLYKKLKVKQWKNRMPTYAPGSFSPKEHSWEEIAQATCQAEIDHEINIIISFCPLLLVPVLGSFWAFFITSLLAAMYDTVFVIIQRFNRPRILKLLKNDKRSSLQVRKKR